MSFSAVDGVGHLFGPRSHEIQDALARLDRTIGMLLGHHDATVGEDAQGEPTRLEDLDSLN